jgi:putative transposase
LKPTRTLSPPGTYFISSTTAERRPFFSKEKYASLLVEVLYHYRKEGKYRLHEWVLMPEHIHLLLTPALGVTIERAMQFIKGGYSHRAGKELTKWEIWQRGFADHRIRDAEDYAIHRAYIRQNPVKRRLVARPEEYRWSSAYPGYELDRFALAAES